MVGVGQIPGSEVANTEEVVGAGRVHERTTARELKVEEIAGSVSGGGGASARRWGDTEEEVGRSGAGARDNSTGTAALAASA